MSELEKNNFFTLLSITQNYRLFEYRNTKFAHLSELEHKRISNNTRVRRYFAYRVEGEYMIEIFIGIIEVIMAT